jgi:AcrR family transcriptional regulator
MHAVASARLSGPERRQRILDAAVESFAERGYEATSVGEIAAAAGITKPVLYDHFGSKRDLFVELMESARDELTRRGAEAFAGDAPLEARLRTAVDAFFAFVEEHPYAARVLLVAPRGEPELQDASREVQAEATRRIAALLVGEPRLLHGAPDRERQLELFTEFLKQGMHGLAEWWSENPEVSRAALVDSVMDIAWAGLRVHASRD